MDAIAVLILSSSRVKEATIRTVVFAILTLREIITACLLVISNCEISKITVHAKGGSTVNGGSVSGDEEAQSVPGERERNEP